MSGRRLGFILAIFIAAGGSLGAQSVEDKGTIENIREAVNRLPYYGVFDFVSFQYDDGTVALSGYVYQPQLKRDIVSAVKRVSRVDDVVDRIEVLPTSQHDDDLRLRAFARIYGDNVLSRYAPGGGLMRDDLVNMRRYPGWQPFGTYPIKIIVNRGRITLAGAVDSTFDRTIAGHRAREIPGAFAVDNALVVAGTSEAR
jgi:BON domain-containing protein